VSSFPAVIESKEKAVSNATVTFTSSGGESREQCPSWNDGSATFGIITEPIALGGNGAEGAFQLVIEEDAGTRILNWRLFGGIHDFSESPTWSTAIEIFTSDGRRLRDAVYGLGGSGSVGGPYTSGACFSNMSPYSASTQGVLRDLSVAINGVQA
jgi:hypothetical protein